MVAHRAQMCGVGGPGRQVRTVHHMAPAAPSSHVLPSRHCIQRLESRGFPAQVARAPLIPMFTLHVHHYAYFYITYIYN